MTVGLRGGNGQFAAPPFTNGPYTWTLANAKADTRFLNFQFTGSMTSGDNRGIYNRLYLTGAGSGGESLRSFTDVEAACGTAHGAHISLTFSGTTTGTLSGLGVAMRATLHIPDDAAWTGGTLSPILAEIYSDGTSSDPDGVTELSFISISNSGDSTGKADVDTDAFLFSIQGFTSGTSKLIEIGTGMGTVTGTLKIKIGADTRYLPFYSAAG